MYQFVETGTPGSGVGYWGNPQSPPQLPCASCGRCPTCGYYRPGYPQYPWYPGHPYITWVNEDDTTGVNNAGEV